jgi:hypothetical protein
MSKREHLEAIAAALRGYGATDIAIERGGKHRRITFAFAGREHFYVLPGNLGGYQAAVEKCLGDIRRMLDLGKPPAAHRGRPRRRRRARRQPAPCPPITVREDPWRPLAAHPALSPEQRARAAWEAWWRFWRASMHAATGRETPW